MWSKFVCPLGPFSLAQCHKYVLNNAPNRNDATGVANNMHLTTMGAIKFSMAAVYLVIIQKSDLQEKRDNNTKTTKVYVCRY